MNRAQVDYKKVLEMGQAKLAKFLKLPARTHPTLRAPEYLHS
jgi:hypothetical protein